jgi:tryprostatin B 6-hydroxylase
MAGEIFGAANFCSDTTASTLTHIFYHLAQDLQQVDKLRYEIAPQIDSSEGILPAKLQYLDHLNGIINETLRLHPPVPTAIPRLTPPEGIQIADVYVPGYITVWCPPYVTGRSTLLQISDCTLKELLMGCRRRDLYRR